MKIGYLTNVYPAVSHSFIKRELQAIEQAGIEIDRWSIRPPARDLPDPDDQLEATKTNVVLKGRRALLSAMARMVFIRPVLSVKTLSHVFRLRPKGISSRLKTLVYFSQACVIVERAKIEKWDHLHVHFGTNPATVAWLARRLGGPPFSFTVHGPDEFDRPEELFLGQKVADSKFAVAISDFGRSQLLRWSDEEDWPKVQVVRCGVDPSYISGAELQGAQTSSGNFCCVARLAAQKGLPVLIEALRQLRLVRTDFHVEILGDGPLRASLEKKVVEYGLADHVTFRGWAPGDAVRASIVGANALIMASFAEGLPVVIMEALALERPVVATKIAGVGELVDEGCGWMVSAGSAEQLCAALVKVLDSDTASLAVLGQEGRRRILARHDAQQNALQLLQLISTPAPAHRWK